MGLRSKLALGLLAAGGAASLLSAPVAAQTPPHVSKAERSAIGALQSALAARDYTAAASALSAAQAAAQSSDARYYVALLQFQLARETSNAAMQASAVETLIALGRMPQAQLGGLYALQGTSALSGRDRSDRDRAAAAFTRAMELAPSPELALTLAQLKIEGRRNGEAIALIERAIQLQKARGQAAPESWYRRGIELALSSKLGPEALKLVRDWVAAYPSPENWRDAMLIYRDTAKPDPETALDALRLQRLAKGLGGERDYMEAAQAFTAARLPGEARSVLEEGVSAHMLDPLRAEVRLAIAAATRSATVARARLAALRTGSTVEAGDQLLSFGDYAAAAQAYQGALSKGAADPNLVNTRLGIALALAGRHAEAVAAFGAVTGPRADLASLWLAWLAQHP